MIKDILKNKKKLIIGLVIFGVIMFTLNYFFGGEGKFVRTGDMVIPRFAHSAVLLKDGRVLITGGYSYSKMNLNKDLSKSAELYDPKTRKFTRTSNMNFPRAYHSTILLNDGRALIVGGGPKNAEIYNPKTNRFSLIGTMPVKLVSDAIHQISLLRLTNGDVIIIGVGKGASTWIIKYLPKINNFIVIGKTKLDHSSQNAILLQNKNIFITGGYKSQKAEFYTTTNNNLTFTNNENDIVGNCLISPSGKDKLLLIENYSNNNIRLFNLKNNEFENAKHPKYWDCKGICTATPLKTGNILIFGIKANKQEIYKPRTERFYPTKRVQINSLWHTATVLQDGNVLITGGLVHTAMITSSKMALLYKN